MTAGASSIPADYTVSLTLDHGALFSSGKSLSNGDDVRILYWNGSAWAEQDRVLDDDSAWNTFNTTIFFQLGAAIAASSSDANYYMYYGCGTAASPPSDPNNIYWYFNDFSSGGLADWTQRDVTTASSWFADSGVLRQEANPNITASTPYINSKLLLTARSTIRDLHVEYNYRARDDDLAAVGLCSNDTSNDGFYVGQTMDRWFDTQNVAPRMGYWVSSSDTDYRAVAHSTNTWYEVQIQWTDSTITIWLDGVLVNTWSTGPSSANYFCLALYRMQGVDFDDLTIRRFVDTEPTTSQGTEENQ